MATVQVGPRSGVTILASGARTTTQTSDDYQGGTGLHLIINMTSAGTGSVTPKIQGKGNLGTYYDILVGSAITTDSVNVLKVGPGIGQVANGAAADILPPTWRVVVTANNANSATYSVTAVML